ncbi:hypothetical protein MFIFM68171_06122 [Madurella fahalii]|uniref:Uncharacterized protein n=1 Tax=Madurella fahalii TaxID=1157608 RepID=A0ABQ0GDU1_9PEZI
MAVEGATEALVAAFFFGIVLNAASAALVLYVRGYGLAVFRDSQRLVLALFLLSAALWAQIDFVTILLDITRSPTPCQVGIIFSTAFDQLARFSIEQFLLWAMNNNNGGKLSVAQLAPQVLVLFRFLAGAVFIGFARPQTDTFCIATTSVLPVGITVAAMDAVIIVLLFIRLYTAGKREDKGAEMDRTRALTPVLLGLVFWTGTSVPLLVGIRTIALAARTALPAVGLLTSIVFVASGAGTLVTPRLTQSRPLEAPSPRRINISRDISSSDSDYPPTRYEDLKEAAIRSSTTFVNPREAPRVKDETSIGYPMGLEAILRQETMPPLPTTTAAVLGPARKLERSGSQKKGLFDFGKGATKIAISNPILQQNAAQNPLDKIAVIDLEAAAMAERERRTRMQRGAETDVNRSAVQSMMMTPEDGVKRAVSLKRKEVASVSLRQSSLSGTLHPEDVAIALTTSAQLSPGGDETRRRSPRQSMQEPVQVQQPVPAEAARATWVWAESPEDRPLAVSKQPDLPQQPVARPEIRPSRMLPPSPATPPPEPTKTPLQRRPTFGLPSNPRARGLRMAPETGDKTKTIMFVNNIEYDDPVGVQTIIKGASDRATKAVHAPETPRTSASVVNRPRPIPRKPAESPAASPSVAHRRSKSGGSLVGRKSLLSAAPGSPTQLPPLPPPPRSAPMSPRPQPNDTKSMTFDEKMILLFPSPSSRTMAKRGSSVPSVPHVPASYLDAASSPTESGGRRRSNRTTKTSIRTESVLEVDEIPPKPGKGLVNTTDEAGSSWLRAFGTGSDDGNSKVVGGKRGSSPVVPADPVRASAWTETTDDRTQDDAMTNWSSIQSPEIAVGVPVVQRIGLPASVRMPGRHNARGPKEDASPADIRDSNTLPIMLDTSTTQAAVVQTRSPSVGDVVATPERATQSQWHRRVGDECPTFSDRKKKTRSRKMSPPTPLLLNNTTTRKTIAIHVEPSPLESPEQALQQIQAQLKKLEDPGRDSLQSPSQRLALLEDLEKEMGQQASHWLEIKHDMARDSLSSIQTTSPARRSSLRESLTAIVNIARESSIRSSIGAERRASRMARMKNSSNPRAPEVSVQDSGSPQMSNWQKRLTEAQLDYMDAQLLRSSNINFMQLSKAQLASPTPPESDQSDDEVPPLPSLPEKAVTTQPSVTQPKPASLWTPVSRKLVAPTGLLWTPALKATPEPEAPLPGLSVRPAQRKELTPLQIQSSQLWRKPYSTTNRSTTGLWRPTWASAAPPVDLTRLSSQGTSQKPPRPVTQRPARRNKRVTLLPDILESPEPLPDKRGTLGIFQFPWGEKSDTAFIQPRPSMFMAMPGTMTSGGPPLGGAMESRLKQFEPTEYSSSFFDDYDDEDDNDDLDSDEDGSDDGFDETTLWEIASLLKTDAVPSKNSLLPPPSSSIVEEYVEELASDEEGQSSREQSIVIGLAAPREPLFQQQRSPASIESSIMATLEDSPQPEKPAPKPIVRVGLPANPKASLTSRPATAESIAPASSQRARHTEPQTVQTVNKQGSGGLRSPLEKSPKASPRGLFVPDRSRLNYRSTDEEPATKYLTRKPRPVELKSLDKLASTSLWKHQGSPEQAQRNWITGEPELQQSLTGRDIAAGLWHPPTDAYEPSLQGLFVLDSSRSSYRSTNKEPAAKYMARNPRPAEFKPLDKLTSTSLWKPLGPIKQTGRNWILTKPKLQRPQASREDWESALNEAISASLWSPPEKLDKPSLQGLFVLGSERASYRSTAEEPAAKYLSRKPRAAEPRPMDQLTSTRLWAPQSPAKQASRNWILGEAKLQRFQASPEAWKAALHEAILASRPQTKKLQRVAAGPAEWDAALQEAIKLSASPPPSSSLLAFDPAARHPVFAATSLITRSEWFHPAATGYTYDVAIVHPVFFGSLAITCAEEAVHPAMSAYAAKKLRRQRRQHSSARSRSASVSRAGSSRSSSRSRRKEEIRSQIRVHEEQELPVSAGRTMMTMSQRDAIQAQIEALEQERLFAQRFAQEESNRRRMSSYYAEPEPPIMVDTVQDLQRHLSRQIRQSLVFGSTRQQEEEKAAMSPVPPVPSQTESGRKPNFDKTMSGSALLWTPPAPSKPVASPTGLWTSQADRSVPSPAVKEDKEAAVRRARRRKVLQRKQRRGEILGQIAAIEAGLNPFANFSGERMWGPVGRKSEEWQMDWLHTVCFVRDVTPKESKGVVLRY